MKTLNTEHKISLVIKGNRTLENINILLGGARKSMFSDFVFKTNSHFTSIFLLRTESDDDG